MLGFTVVFRRKAGLADWLWKIGFILWVFLFLSQGPIYATLIISAILVVIGVRQRRLVLSLTLVLLADTMPISAAGPGHMRLVCGRGCWPCWMRQILAFAKTSGNNSYGRSAWVWPVISVGSLCLPGYLDSGQPGGECSCIAAHRPFAWS